MKGIPVITKQGCGIVILDDIDYIECSYRRATIHFNRQVCNVYLTPDEVNSYLDSRFDRCMSTMFVNHDRVRFMRDGTICFFNGEEIMLGRKSFARAKKEYILYIRNLQKTLAKDSAL